MSWTSVSSGAGSRANEDHVAVFEQENAGGRVVDIVVLDGGSSVAPQNYICRELGDVVWFVQRFSDAFRKALAGHGCQEQLVRSALETVRAEFHERTAGLPAPVYAWPIAAMTWIRILPGRGPAERGPAELIVYCLGDCKTLLRKPDGTVQDLDPWVNPQEAVVQEAIAALAREGVSDPAARRERLLPMLRRRREEQNTAPFPETLCLAPAGPFAARRYSVRAEPGSKLLCMTDGFYRLVAPYGLHTDASLMRACVGEGLDSMLAALRRHERVGGAGTGMAVKQADDASAVLWEF